MGACSAVNDQRKSAFSLLAVYTRGDPLKASLYIHVPFCQKKCGYCDFYSVPVSRDDPVKALYADRIIKDSEMLFRKFDVDQVPTVYIGGGTPSVLGAVLFSRMINGLHLTQMLHKPAEVTAEANPESSDDDFLCAAKSAGVTRLSLGVQTFSETSRKAIGRAGDVNQLPEKLKKAADAFRGNFSIDLMSGLPFQNKKTLAEDIKRTLDYGPAHISLYSLTMENKKPVSTDKSDYLWITGRDILEKSGYMQYEVSNFCIPGNKSLHNLRYWKMENWLGLGPAASGTIISNETGTGHRYTNIADTDQWLDRESGKEPPMLQEYLDVQTLIKEIFLMGFRLVDGPDEISFKNRFGKNIEDFIPETIKQWRDRGLFCHDRISLSKNGLLLLDRFLAEAFIEAEKKSI